MLELCGIRKSYGATAVLSGVDLRVEPGEILGLLGPNGAGKSTLIGIAAGLDTAFSGTVTVNGMDAVKHRAQVADLCGIAPQELGIYPPLTVRQNLDCFAGLAGLRGRSRRARVDEVITLLRLESCADNRGDTLSGGQKRRLHTGMAVLNRPRVLFLDEPTVGADVRSRADILAIVTGLAHNGTAVVYTSHYLDELEQLNANVAILNSGTIAVRGSLTDVIAEWASGSVTLTFAAPAPELPGRRRDGARLIADALTRDGGTVLAETLQRLGESAADLVDVEIARPNLERAFLAVIDSERTSRGAVA